VETLVKFVADLPADLPAAVFIVLHIPAQAASVLPGILNRSGPLPATHLKDGEAIQHGRIYVAPPDYHLLLKHGCIRLARGPMENGHRPAIDPLFRTAARAYGRRVTGVILSGTLDDGTAGLMELKMRGGMAVVQDPDDALFSGMPRSAVDNVDVDHVLPLSDIARVVVSLAHQAVDVEAGDEEGEEMVPDDMEIGEIAELDMSNIEGDKPGAPSPFGCPDCGGVLWELRKGDSPQGELIRFRCRVGHAYSAGSLLAKQAETLEAALWAALRALEESAALARGVAERTRKRGRGLAAARFDEQAYKAQQSAALIREVLLKGQVFASQESHASGLEEMENEANQPEVLGAR
jgi:two-component system chemotaxis response regulator CheB